MNKRFSYVHYILFAMVVILLLICVFLLYRYTALKNETDSQDDTQIVQNDISTVDDMEKNEKTDYKDEVKSATKNVPVLDDKTVKDFINGDITFKDFETKKEVTTKTVLGLDKSIYMYTVFDIDQDGVDELALIFIEPPLENGYICADGYSYIIDIQGSEYIGYGKIQGVLDFVKIDGTLNTSPFDVFGSYFTMKFGENGVEYNYLMSCSSNPVTGYSIDGKMVSEEEFSEAIDVYESKPEPKWIIIG